MIEVERSAAPMNTIPSYANSVKPQAIAELEPGKQWVCFNRDKIPFNPQTGKAASADDPNTWGTYEQAVRAVKASNGRYAGVGREFLKEQGITGIDLDHCIVDGKPLDYAQFVIKRLNSYTELSPSGVGLHIWVYGSIPDNIGPDPKGVSKIEMYDQGRYFTITGNHLEGTPLTIENRSEEIAALHAEVREARRQGERRYTSTYLPLKARAYAQAALRDEERNVFTAANGSRNHTLNIAAYKLGRLVGGGELSRGEVENVLGAAAERAGLSASEIDKTLRSGIDAGMREPRTAPVKEEPYQAPTPAPRAAATPQSDTTEIDLCEFTPDDAGNGDAMFALFGEDFLYCAARGWFANAGTHWQLDADGAEVRKKAVDTLRKRRHAAVDAEKEPIIKCTVGDERRVNGCVSRFKTLVNVSIDEFDDNPNFLNCKNGVVDLRTGNVEPHTRCQRFTYCLPVEYGAADYSEWIEYLDGVVGGGQEVINYLQMALGYSFTGHTQEEILFYLFGPTRSGKGTFAETIMALLPKPIATMVDFNSFTAKREGDVSNFDLAPLKPSRIIFASESNRSQTLNPAKIKQLTGGDHITACFKHKDFFSYRPQFKVWMMSNHPVNGDPEDDALWGRVRVIEFPHSFLGVEDKTKKARLREQEALKGVLYWIVEGAKKWYSLGAKGLETPQAIAETTQAQRAELDYVQQWLDEECQVDEVGDLGLWAPNEVVTASYTQWCKNNNVQYPKGSKALAQSLKAKGFNPGQQKWMNGKNKRGVGGLYIFSEDPNT
jgi:putative DNA primase/helicase